MELSLPDPITNHNRQIARQRYLRREEYVLDHHPGFNLVYWRRIIRAPARLDRLGHRWGWPPDRLILTKALLISRMTCVFIDHIIRRMQQADILPAPGAPHLEWERQYRSFLLLFLRATEIPERRNIVKHMQRLHRYTMPPASLIRFRQRHWPRIERSLPPLLTPSGAANLFIRRQLAAQRNPVVAARRICFTAALYSDIQERLYNQQWMYAYSDCLLRLYEHIRKKPDVFAAIIALE